MSTSDSDSESTPTRFTINEEMKREYRRFNTEGTELTVHLPLPTDGDATNPVSHFQATVAELIEYALRDCQDSNMVGITIRNEDNVQDKPIGYSFRRKDQISEEVVCYVFEKVVQSNA
jgi:hypothetical protein